jgi:hypothetical protein
VALVTKPVSVVLSADNELTPTPSLVSTDLYHDELLTHIQTLLSTNFDCTLPCFGGLEPGEADKNDIKKFIEKIDYNNAISDQLIDTPPYNFALFFGNHGLLIVGLSAKKDVLQRTTIGITNPSDWLPESIFDLPNLVGSLGSPENIFMEFFGPPLGFSMVVVYDAKGVLIRYMADFNPEAIDDDQPLPICFSPDSADLYQIDVWLQNPENDALVEENQWGLRDSHRETRPFWPLDKVTGYTETEFTDFFTNNPDGCIKALSPHELIKAGYVF